MNTIILNTISDDKVIVRKAAENGGNAGGGSSMKYVIFNSETDLITYGEVLGMFSYLVKFPTKIETLTLMVGFGGMVNDAIAFAIDPTAVVFFQGEKKTVKDWALSFGADLDLLPRITEEEFYNTSV